MTSRTTLLLLLVGLSLYTIAQETTESDSSYWTKGGLTRVTFSNVALSNWAAGGQSSSSVASFVTLFADKRTPKHKWKNSLDLAYGVIKQGSQPVQKSDDKINYLMRYGWLIKRSPKWFFTSSIDFRTQFAPGFAPNEFISFSYKPVTGKITIVSDDKIVGTQGAYGVKPGENTRLELGSFFSINYKQEAIKNVKVDSRLELFTNYEKASFGLVDVNWQNSIVMKINGSLSTDLFTQLIYDDDIKTERINEAGDVRVGGAQVQLKSVFGIGLTYSFGAERPKD